MKTAIVHEWLSTYAGSEKVLEQLLLLYPQADLFSVVDFLPDDQRAFLNGRQPRTTFIQKLPGARRHFRHYLPLMPLAVEQHDLSAYELVISSNHAVAKGVLTGPDQIHICYCHSPIRYAWDLQHQYLAESGMTRGARSWLARSLLHYMRLWDHRTAHGVDHFIANSAFIARRIRKIYGREAHVLPPPVDVSAFTLHEAKEAFYLAASRMVPYKKMPLIIEAFARMPQRQLVMIGDGPEMERCRAAAANAPNVRLLGYQRFEVLREHMQRARAFVFAAEEDFGITPVEAQACGTPVIAFGRGGALDSVVASDDPARRTGLFFTEQTTASITDAIERFEAGPAFDPQVCRRNAERFGTENFRVRLAAMIEDLQTA